MVRCHLTQAALGRNQNHMTDQFGPDFDHRLKASLDRSYGPTPLPESARFSRQEPGRGRLGPIKLGIATAAALALLMVAASALAGGPDPSTWTQKAVSSFESVTHGAQATPSPVPTRSPQAQSHPPVRTSPAGSGHESPEASDGSHHDSGASPTPYSGSHDERSPGASPSPSPGSDEGGQRSSESPSPPGSQP
jgi:hypothetical protein